MNIGNFSKVDAKIKAGSMDIPIKYHWDTHAKRYKNIKKKIKSNIFILPEYKGHLVYVEVPSSVDGLFYQVILQIDTEKMMLKKIEDLDVKIFSNSPAFMYNFAYVYKNMIEEDSSDGLIIKNLYKKYERKNSELIDNTDDFYDKRATTKEPVIKNPLNLPLLDYTVASAMMYVLDYYNHSTFSYSTKITFDTLFKRIYSVEDILIQREKIKTKNKKKETMNILKKEGAPKSIQKAAEEGFDSGKNVRLLKNDHVKISRSNNVRKIKSLNSISKEKVSTSHVVNRKKKI